MDKVIELFWNYPILYYVPHEDYKNIRKKDKVWNKIGDEIGENDKFLVFMLVCLLLLHLTCFV